MNFNYSYKAFLISSLLIGSLVLLLFGLKLAKKPIEEETIPIEYTVEEVVKEPKKDLAKAKLQKIETHKVYNQNEKFIKELETERSQPLESTQDKLDAMKEAIEKTKTSKNIVYPKTPVLKKTFKKEENQSNNPKSTNSYRLINRKALYFPNPVYTCDGFGKVTISITVDASGRVIKAAHNKTFSNTTNLCLIETAINYAKKTRFTTSANQEKQKGTITYIFPGH
ncbi:MAG: hypothetical protein ACWA45_10010 [Flavobacteriales bacterium]